MGCEEGGACGGMEKGGKDVSGGHWAPELSTSRPGITPMRS